MAALQLTFPHLQPVFAQIWSNELEPRLDGSVDLLNTLMTSQARFRNSEGSEPNGDAKFKSRGFTELESRLGQEHTDEVVYSLRRLIRGLTSPRDSSRLGFSVALSEVRLRVLSSVCLILDVGFVPIDKHHGRSHACHR